MTEKPGRVCILTRTSGPIKLAADRKVDDSPRVSVSPDGGLALVHYSMADLAAFLGKLTQQTVIDQTDLGGYFDIGLTIEPSLIAVPSPNVEGAGETQPQRDQLQGSIFGAVKPLGLKVETRNELIRHVVVTAGNRKPLEN